MSQEIRVSDIRSIEASRKKIKILSKSYNLFNGNGMIGIPAEVNHYEQLKLKLERLQLSDRK